MIRVGLIGAGFVAAIHAQAYAEVGTVEASVVAVAASTLDSAQSFADRHGIPAAYGDYRRLLARDDIGAVDICTPNHLHEAMVVDAVRANKHVLCEKPLTGYFGGPEAANPVGATEKRVMLAHALRSADRMIDAAQTAGVKLVYAENWVYCPAIRRAAELAKAAGGTILEIRAEESHSGSHAAYAKHWSRSGGGSLMRLAPHPIGAALHLKHLEGLWREGRPIRAASVTAEVGRLTELASFRAEHPHWLVDDWHDVESWGAVIITFEDGSRAVIQATDVSLGGIETPFEVRMSNGRIRCDVSHSGMIRAFAPDAAVWGDAYLMEKVDHKGGWSYPSVDEHWMLGYPHEIRDFLEAVAYERLPLSTAALGRQVVQVIYAAYQSAEEGRRIDLWRDDGC
jgi:predicted dehydrogenase